MKRMVIIATAALLGMSLCGCGGSTADGEASVQSVASILGYGSVGMADRFAGIVSSRSQVEIEKNAEQKVAKILVKEGDEVQEGQVLFVYDSDEARLNRDKAKLELEQLKNSITTKKAQIEKLEKDKNKASKDQKLSYDIEIQELEADVQEANYNIAVKEKEIEKLTNTLNNLEVKSTVNGIVQTIKDEDNPNMGYDENQSNAFMVITETGNYRVKGTINETNAGAIVEGMPVVIRSRVSDQTWSGTISGVDWSKPVQGNQNYYMESAGDEMTTSSKYPFYVELNEMDGLLLGQHVFIEPDFGQDAGEEEAQIRLASWYLYDTDGKAWVWAENSKGKLEKRNVTLGDYDAELDSWVILSGLKMEDYIAFPDENLSAGMKCVEYNDSFGAMDFTDGFTDEFTEEGYKEFTEEEYVEETEE